MSSKLTIPIRNSRNKEIAQITITGKEGSLFHEPRAYEEGEAEYQIIEGHFYDYGIVGDNVKLAPLEDIVSPNQSNPAYGSIRPNVYVGTLQIEILDNAEERVSVLPLEVRSIKMSYREDYRNMLRDITERSFDLLMLQSSPITHLFGISHAGSPETYYQRFAFVSSIIMSEQFELAIMAISEHPIRRWNDSVVQRSITNVHHIGASELRQIASNCSRMKTPINHSLRERFATLPRNLYVQSHQETLDVSENQFVKFVLNTFYSFCSDIGSHPKAGKRLKTEARLACDRLLGFLSLPIFRNVSGKYSMPSNSPALQRKEGYRELLQWWFMFDMAASLEWKGADEIYSGSKRNVAVLYEYWLFFQLLDIVKNKFDIDKNQLERIIGKSSDGLTLSLKQGDATSVNGTYTQASRKLNVRFSYNRRFDNSTSDYQIAGSWTIEMRPDYTLSLWPGDISEEVAEKEELITHIHFDAKYRIEGLGINTEASVEDITSEKKEEEKGIYKRADILKMHAYKDAIRRTSGAYVLYPGSVTEKRQAFHEVIPGLGAFPISPSNDERGKIILSNFIDDVIRHFLDRTSQREILALRRYQVLSQPSLEVREMYPETIGDQRNSIPSDTYVIIGYIKDEDHLEWVENSLMYNIRLQYANAPLQLSQAFTRPRYLLLHNEKKNLQKLYRLDEQGPKVLRSSVLKRSGYPSEPSQEYYFIYTLSSEKVEEELGFLTFKLLEILKYYNHTGGTYTKPLAIPMSELLKKVKHDTTYRNYYNSLQRAFGI